MNYKLIVFHQVAHYIFLGSFEKEFEVTSYNIQLRKSMLKLSWIVMDHVKEGFGTYFLCFPSNG
jgi:hypothetical protein